MPDYPGPVPDGSPFSITSPARPKSRKRRVNAQGIWYRAGQALAFITVAVGLSLLLGCLTYFSILVWTEIVQMLR